MLRHFIEWLFGSAVTVHVSGNVCNRDIEVAGTNPEAVAAAFERASTAISDAHADRLGMVRSSSRLAAA